MGENEEIRRMIERGHKSIKRVCVMCKAEFEISYDTQYFCSPGCREERYRRGLSRPPEEKGGTP